MCLLQELQVILTTGPTLQSLPAHFISNSSNSGHANEQLAISNFKSFKGMFLLINTHRYMCIHTHAHTHTNTPLQLSETCRVTLLVEFYDQKTGKDITLTGVDRTNDYNLLE